METLRYGLSETLNELNKLLRITSDSDEETKLRKLRRIYFSLFEQVILQEIDKNTIEYKDALESLELAHKTIEDAKADIERVADAINKAVIAAKAVDKIVKLGIDLLA
jgi:hypothetical protein